MKIEELRTLHQARPFRPFAIHTADGRTFPIPHNEFLAYDSEGATIVALRNDHPFSILDMSLVTELEVLPANGESKNPKGARKSSVSAPWRRISSKVFTDRPHLCVIF